MGKKNKKNRKRQLPDNETTSAESTKTKPPVEQSTRKKESSAVLNPLQEKLSTFLNKLSENERNSFFSNSLVDPERRAALWEEQADLGESLVRQYSWAIPDSRSIAILRHFSPLIEIGCGANAYWCRQMLQAGIDVVGYDKDPSGGGRIGANKNDAGTETQKSFKVHKGEPEVLSEKKHAHRTLFLCYPDEEHAEHNGEDSEPPLSMGASCLQYYEGDYVIHVGELFLDATLSMDQAPWGRSSSPEFQQRLAAEFHCLLHVNLPNWLHTRDSLSVWKRSETCSIVFAADDDDDDDDDEEFEYRHVPVAERLPTNLAAPCLQHLLAMPPDGTQQMSTCTDEKAPQIKDKQSPKDPSSKKKKKMKKGSTSGQQDVLTGANGDNYDECPW
jgi:hypothetical protein